jgi:hypothetical protein
MSAASMRRIQLPNLLALILLWVTVSCGTVKFAWGAEKADEVRNQEIASRGMNKLMDGDFDHAMEIFRQILSATFLRPMRTGGRST